MAVRDNGRRASSDRMERGETRKKRREGGRVTGRERERMSWEINREDELGERGELEDER